MSTNVFSNFNFIDAFNANKKRFDDPFGTKKHDSMFRSVRTFTSCENFASLNDVAKLALPYYELLVQDNWVTTDRDFFGMVSAVADACFDAEHIISSEYQALRRIVHSLAYLPLDVEGNRTPARRYMEVMCSVREKPDLHLHTYAAAIAVFAYLVERIHSDDSAETWIRHHWRFDKFSNMSTLSLSMHRHSAGDYSYAQHLASLPNATYLPQAHRLVLKWAAETLACIYSRVYVPAVLKSYGNPTYRAAYNVYVSGGCHEDN